MPIMGSILGASRLSFGTLSLFALALGGCETPNPYDKLNISAPVSSLKKNKGMRPYVAHAFLLLNEGKYSEASTYINQSLQSYPKSIILHILNGITYEKLAENGDATGLELAIVGYQNAARLDPFNSFSIIQLGKIRYREKQFHKAQEHFANALLIKPNDPDLIHEFAAASYYSYDIKTALSSIQRAIKLKPEDPLIHRSAAMIHAAVGDFKLAEKHFKFFEEKAGKTPQVAHVAQRFNDWQFLYKSGRIKLAAAQAPVSTTTSSSSSTGSDSSTSSSSTSSSSSSNNSNTSSSTTPSAPCTSSTTSSSSGSGTSVSKASNGDTEDVDTDENLTINEEPAASGNQSKGKKSPNAVGTPVTSSVALGGPPTPAPPPVSSPPTPSPAASPAPLPSPPPLPPRPPVLIKVEPEPQIIIDCYILQITEDEGTIKGNNILNNLAITLNPGTYGRYKANMFGKAAAPLNPSAPGDKVIFQPDSAFAAGIFDPITGKTINTFTSSQLPITLNNLGSIAGQIFAAGITWAGLTYSLNIANSADQRTEIVSRPTLMTFLKKESRFFSGIELVNVSGGNYGSNLSRYQVGTTVSVIPESIVGELITLNIGIEASILQTPNPNLLATIDVGKTRVETTARVRLGDTIMLGGIYERDQVDLSSGFPGLKDVPLLQYFFSRTTTVSSRRSIVLLLTPRSPDTVKSAVNRAMTRESVTPHLNELVSRNPDWFTPNTNAINIFNYINLDPVLYYEFRTGDILPPSWKDEPVLRDKLAELASFLYF